MTYYIPENFMEQGKLFNGMFKTRNFIEAIILSVIVGIPLWIIPYPSVSVKVMVLISVIFPIFLVSVAGINDDSLIEFLRHYRQWRKNKRVILYNHNARPKAVRASEVVSAEEIPKDKIIEAFDSWKAAKKAKNSQITFVEGEDFIFASEDEESSSFLNAEKKLMGIDDSPKQKKKSKKETKMLQATNPVYTTEQKRILNDEMWKLWSSKHPQKAEELETVDMSDIEDTDIELSEEEITSVD